nr:MAG TPA: hypothetical protein [Caudoviricetes sp.]
MTGERSTIILRELNAPALSATSAGASGKVVNRHVCHD